MKLFLVILNILLIAILGVRAIFCHIYSNTFHAGYLAAISIVLGAAAGYFLAVKNDDVVEEDNDDEFEKYKLYATCITFCTIASFILAFNLNYVLSFSSKRIENTLVYSVQPYMGTRGGTLPNDKLIPTAFMLWIDKNGNKESVRKAEIADYQEIVNVQMPLTFRKGLFGFDCFLP